MNKVLIVLKHLIPALQAIQKELSETEVRETEGHGLEKQAVAPPKAKKDTDSRKILKLTDAASFLGVSNSFVYRLAERGAIPHYKVGSRLRFDEAKLRSWLETCAKESLASRRRPV